MERDRIVQEELWQQVLRRLREDISSGALAPGTRLVEVDLAERFGVSRGPIREALRELTRSGLALDRPRQGVFVSTPSDSDLEQAFVFREALETAAARIALRQVTPRDVDRLRSILESMEKAYADRAREGSLALDLEFHRELFLFSGNNRMLSAHDDLAAQLLLAAAHNDVLREGVYPPVALHRDIYDALVAGDEERLVAAVQAHYAWTGDRLFGPDQDLS
jgi:DNA-binding GntR family transcriptional regulator